MAVKQVTSSWRESSLRYIPEKYSHPKPNSKNPPSRYYTERFPVGGSHRLLLAFVY